MGLPVCYPFRDKLFNLFNDCFECLRFVHRKVSENLTVQGDTLGVEFTDELRISHSMCADCGVDTRDPQRAECSLLEFAVSISELQTLLDSVFGYCPNVSP